MSSKIEFNLLEEEAEAFEKFKKQMKELYGPEANDDVKLYRFLKAREFNIKQAEVMFRNHVTWRKQMKVDTILEDYKLCEVQEKYYNPSIIGYDRRGHLVAFMDVGNVDFKGLLKCERSSEYVKGLVYLLTKYEKLLEEQSKKLGRPIDKWISVLDYENYSLAQAFNKPCMDLFFEVTHMYEANYPERIESIIVINASRVFFTVYNIVKYVIPKRTLEKLKVFGRDGWKQELVKIIDPAQLPAFLGGEKTDPDGNPLCLTMINFHKPVPKHYYFRSTERRLRGEEGTQEYVIKRMDKVDILFHVDQPNSCIQWEFESEIGDISFGLFKKGDCPKEEPEPVVPMKRVNAHQQIESGMFVCEANGTYVLTFDNSYSWIREKQIFCRASVKKFNEHRNSTS